MEAPSVLAVVVAHGSGSRLTEALEALAVQTYPDLSVVLVTVGDVSVPTDAIPGGLHRVEVPSGTGFPEAVIRALDQSSSEAPFVLLMHDDAAPDPEVVQALVERAATDPEIAAVGAKLVDWETPEILLEVGGGVDRFAVRRSGLEVEEVDHGQHDQADEVLYCSAACLLVRRETLDAVGGLDTGAWPLYEDVDLCWRFRAMGRRVVVVPRARVRHVAALSKGLRRGAGKSFGALGMRTHAERGRLRFMLKNYGVVSLAAILPQYALKALGTILRGLVRREFWRLRVLLTVWLQVVRELPSLLDARRNVPPQVVEDRELLRLGARRTLVERRYERVALIERIGEVLQAFEQRVVALARDPVAWAGLLGIAMVLLTLRGVLFGGAFTLGELRHFPRFGDALGVYLERVRPEGLDPIAPGSAAIVLLGALRSLVGGRAGLAQVLVLLVPLGGAAFGAVRLGRVLGIGDRGRRWLAVAAMVNPMTLVFVREGFVGALVTWAASMWVAAVVLDPPRIEDEPRDRRRRAAGWVLGWAVTGAFHPPALLWLAALGLGLSVARRGDELAGRRVRLVGLGLSAAVALNLPWSLHWFTAGSPVVGRTAGFVPIQAGGLDGATLGAGWPFVAWTLAALAGAYLVGLTRTSLGLIGLFAAAWLAAAAAVLPAPTGLAAAGWCTIGLLGLVSRRISDELPRFGLGLRHAAVLGIVAVLAGAWLGAGLLAVRDGTGARTLPIILAEDQATGRVLWLAGSGDGILTWATAGFDQELGAFPAPSGPGERIARSAVEAVRRGQTHRVGGVLALLDVSHVVALHPQTRRGLAVQADLSPQEEQAGAMIYRNDAWVGPAMLLSEAPERPLTPTGLADVVRDMRGVDVRSLPNGGFRMEVPDDATGVLYVAGGAGRGWTVGEERARPAAGGTWAPVEGLSGRVEAEPPAGRYRLLYPLQGILLLALAGMWLVAVYLTTPESTGPVRVALDLRTLRRGRTGAVLPLLALAAVGWFAWTAPGALGAGRFLSSAWYCPPIGQGYAQRIAIANPTDVPVPYLVRADLSSPPTEEGTLVGQRRVTVEIDPTQGAVVESYGREVVVATEVSREGSFDASLCADRAREQNLFPEGGRAATRAVPRLFEAYVLYNPFPDLARASVRFISPDETIAPPALADVRVEPGEFRVVDPEEQFEPMLDLSAEITVWQGRAIVARRLRTVEQVSWSLPTDPVDGGVLPRASTARFTTAVIAVNAGEESVQVSLSPVGPEGGLPREDFEVPPRRRSSFDLNEVAPDMSPLLVRVSADRPIAMESLVAPDDRATVSLLAPQIPATRWAIPMGEDRAIMLVNPGATSVRAELIRLGVGPPFEAVTIPPGGIHMGSLGGGSPFGVLVRTRGGGVTVAAIGRAGTLPGIPVR